MDVLDTYIKVKLLQYCYSFIFDCGNSNYDFYMQIKSRINQIINIYLQYILQNGNEKIY